LDALRLEPARHHEIPLLPVGMAGEVEGCGGDAGGARADERVGVLAVRGDGADGQAGIEQRLQVGAMAADEHADHTIRPITSSSEMGSATTAQKPIPRLNTRRSSFSSTWRASQAKTGGRCHEPHSSSALRPTGSTRPRLPAMPPPVTWTNALARFRSERASVR